MATSSFVRYDLSCSQSLDARSAEAEPVIGPATSGPDPLARNDAFYPTGNTGLPSGTCMSNAHNSAAVAA